MYMYWMGSREATAKENMAKATDCFIKYLNLGNDFKGCLDITHLTVLMPLALLY